MVNKQVDFIQQVSMDLTIRAARRGCNISCSLITVIWSDIPQINPFFYLNTFLMIANSIMRLDLNIQRMVN